MISPPNKTVVLAVVLALTLPLAGCSGLLADGEDGPDGDGPDVDSEQLRSDTVAAMNDVETARIASDMTMQMESETLTIQSEGVIDLEDRRMRMTTNSSGAGAIFESEQYLLDGTQYMHSEMLGGWVKQNLTAVDPWEANQFGQQRELLEAAELEVTGRTTTDGHEVYVSELTVGGETMSEIIAQQTEDTQMPQAQQDISFGNVTVTQHIDVETNRVRYVEMEYSLSMSGDEVSMTLEQRFSEFNEPVDIELPAAAENAEPISDSVDA